MGNLSSILFTDGMSGLAKTVSWHAHSVFDAPSPNLR